MQGSELVALIAIALLFGAAVFAIRANMAIAQGRSRLIRLARDITDIAAEKEDRRKVKERNQELLRATTEIVNDLTVALDSASAELKELESKPPTRIFPLSKKANAGQPIYMAAVLANTGFGIEAGGAVDTAETRNYAGPAADEASFREELVLRFPADGGFDIGEIKLFMLPEGMTQMARKNVA